MSPIRCSRKDLLIPPLFEAAKFLGRQEQLVLKEFPVEIAIWESISLSAVTTGPTRPKG
jgi:hypothetical protein